MNTATCMLPYLCTCMFHVAHRDLGRFSRMLHAFCMHRDYMHVACMFPVLNCTYVACMLHYCCMHVTLKWHACYTQIACMLHSKCMHVTCMWHACHMHACNMHTYDMYNNVTYFNNMLHMITTTIVGRKMNWQEMENIQAIKN